MMTSTTLRLASFALLALGMIGMTVMPLQGVDYVILKDGTILQGKYFREKATIKDTKGAGIFQVDKANGLEGIDTGPKTICFGSIGAQIGEQGKDNISKPDSIRYERRIPAAGYLPLPGSLQLSALEFDNEWKTKFKVNTGDGNWQEIKLHLTSLDPSTAFILSSSHRWRLCFDTKELGPDYVRKLLVNHPTLIEKTGPDPEKRLAIAQFFNDTGWLDAAQKEIDLAKKEITTPWSTKALEKADQLRATLDRSIAHQVTEQCEKALIAGRYRFAEEAIKLFKPEHADPKDVTRIANIKSQLEAVTPRYTQAKKSLANILDKLEGHTPLTLPSLALFGTISSDPKKTLTGDAAILSQAGRSVLIELHPDTTIRLDLFNQIASQNDPKITPEQLLSLAITGFLKGKNGASQDVASAVRCWNARQMVSNYLKANYANDRIKIVSEFQKTVAAAPFDEIAQIISLLTPVKPLDPIKPGDAVPNMPTIFTRNTGQIAEKAGGIDYAIHLPPEYHHGRAYPVVIAVCASQQSPTEIIARLAPEADRNGFIVVAPNWTSILGKNGYDFSGEGHFMVTGVLQDLVKRVNVDSDRVMLFGCADGGTLALDVAVGHPDHFAGLATFGSFPKSDIYMDYWSNLQKVPQYAVSGELAGEPLKQTYNMFVKLLKAGFPSLFIVYKGRAIEFYAAEVEPMFDWFHRRVRPPTATIIKNLPGVQNVNQGAKFDWVTMRKSDQRFYWINCDTIASNYLMKPPKGNFPASINPDIKSDRNLISVKTRGIKQFTVFFERDMIDWTKPLLVDVNGNNPPGYKPKVLQPDLNVMLEEFRTSGDRKRLFLNKMTFTGF